jgi:hypothetical protein
MAALVSAALSNGRDVFTIPATPLTSAVAADVPLTEL